jgi:hypothetical protein
MWFNFDYCVLQLIFEKCNQCVSIDLTAINLMQGIVWP